MSTAKTVYILGAGASKHAGLPLLSNFFQHAYSLREKNQCDQYPPNGYVQALNEVDEFRKKLKAEKPGVNVHNIEHVYAEALKIQNTHLVHALDQVILGVLDLGGCTVNYQGQQYKPDSTYTLFIKNVLTDPQTTFITFNWDCLLDYALFFNNHTVNYCLNSTQAHGAVKLIKIHGSINFGQCKDCGHSPHIIRPNGKISFRPGIEHEKNKRFDLRLVTEILPNEKCSKCSSGRLSPIIVPPALEKNFSELLQNPLAHAESAIAEAEKLYFIGYSFPETDTYFINFIRKALKKNIRLTQIDVINPDTSLKALYENHLEAAQHHFMINMVPDTFETFSQKYHAS